MSQSKDANNICLKFSRIFNYDPTIKPRGISLEEKMQNTSFMEAKPLTFTLKKYNSNETWTQSFKSFVEYTKRIGNNPVFNDCIFPLFCRIVIILKNEDKNKECNYFINMFFKYIPENMKQECKQFLEDKSYYEKLKFRILNYKYIVKVHENERNLLVKYINVPRNSKIRELIMDTITLEPIMKKVDDKKIYMRFSIKNPFHGINVIKSKINCSSFAAINMNNCSVYGVTNDTNVVEINTINSNIKSLYHHQVSVSTLSKSNSSEVLLTGDILGELKLWSKNGTASIMNCCTPAWCSKFAPNCGVFAVGFDNGTVDLFDSPQHRLRRVLYGHKSSVLSVDFHPNCSLLGSISKDTALRIWDIRESSSVRLFICNKVNYNADIAFSKNGKYIAAWDKNLYLNDIGSGETIFKLPTPKINDVIGMYFSFDSNYIYLMGTRGELLCCNINTQEMVQLFNINEKVISFEYLPSNEFYVVTNNESL